MVFDFEKFHIEAVSLAERSDGTFSSISNDFLGLLYTGLNSHRKRGQVPEGKYRQKGNVLRDLIIELVKRKFGYSLKERTITGLTGDHKVDLSFLTEEALLVAGEVKLSGTPSHTLPRTHEEKPVREAWVDLDKRLKEVCYTAVDLKLKFGGTNVGDWRKWIATGFPKFYSIWGLYMGNKSPENWHSVQGKLDLLVPKFLKLKNYYHAGVGVFFYGETAKGYEQITDKRVAELTIDKVIQDMVLQIKNSGIKSQGMPR